MKMQLAIKLILSLEIQLWLSAAVKVLYVIPDDSASEWCLQQPCATLDQYLAVNQSLPILVNVEYHFFPGKYYIFNDLKFAELHNVSLIGMNNGSNFALFITFSKSSLFIEHSCNVTIARIAFEKHHDSKLKKRYENPTALSIRTCISCKLKHITFTECRLDCLNLLGNSHISEINISISAAVLNSGLCYFGIILQSQPPHTKLYNFGKCINKSVVIMNKIMINGKDNPCHSTDSTHGVGIFIDLHYDSDVFITDSRFYRMSHTVVRLSDSCSSNKATIGFKNGSFD